MFLLHDDKNGFVNKKALYITKLSFVVYPIGGMAMLKLKKISTTYDMKVFTDDGLYFGDVEEAIVSSNRLFGWRVKSTKNSYLTKVLGGAKGVIVPHQLVKAIGGIMIISRAAIPAFDDREIKELEQQQN